MRYFSWNHTHLIFSSLIIIFGNLLVAFFHTQITIVLNRQDHIISYSLLRYVDNSIISFHHHKIVQIWLTTMLKSLWFDLINFLVSLIFSGFFGYFCFCFWHFWATSHSFRSCPWLNWHNWHNWKWNIKLYLYDIFRSIIKYCWGCKVEEILKVSLDSTHHLHLQWKFTLWTGKLAWSVKAKHCWALSINY